MMRLLITDLNTEIKKDLEKKSAGTDVEIDVFKDSTEVTDVAWNKADAIITYRARTHVDYNVRYTTNITYNRLYIPTTRFSSY